MRGVSRNRSGSGGGIATPPPASTPPPTSVNQTGISTPSPASPSASPSASSSVSPSADPSVGDKTPDNKDTDTSTPEKPSLLGRAASFAAENPYTVGGTILGAGAAVLGAKAFLNPVAVDQVGALTNKLDYSLPSSFRGTGSEGHSGGHSGVHSGGGFLGAPPPSGGAPVPPSGGFSGGMHHQPYVPQTLPNYLEKTELGIHSERNSPFKQLAGLQNGRVNNPLGGAPSLPGEGTFPLLGGISLGGGASGGGAFPLLGGISLGIGGLGIGGLGGGIGFGGVPPISVR